MKCAIYLDALLDAAPAELRGVGDGELAEHLRSCPSCRRLADTILADSRMLADAVDRSERARVGRRGIVVAGLAAAGIVIALTVRAITIPAARPIDAARMSQPTPRVASSARVDAGPTATRAPVEARINHVNVRAGRATPKRIQAVAIRPHAIVAVPIRSGDVADAVQRAPVVSVRPHGGRRAAVFRIAESNVTVVWLY